MMNEVFSGRVTVHTPSDIFAWGMPLLKGVWKLRQQIGFEAELLCNAYGFNMIDEIHAASVETHLVELVINVGVKVLSRHAYYVSLVVFK